MKKITEYTINRYFRENFPYKSNFDIFRFTELPQITLYSIKTNFEYVLGDI